MTGAGWMRGTFDDQRSQGKEETTDSSSSSVKFDTRKVIIAVQILNGDGDDRTKDYFMGCFE